MTVARILVADDEASVRSVLRRFLESEGHTVEDVSDGEAALAVIGTHPPDLVITDVYMPGTDGYTLIRKMRQLAPGVRVISMSGGAWDDARQALELAQGLGAHATIVKPFELEDLRRIVREALGQAP